MSPKNCIVGFPPGPAPISSPATTGLENTLCPAERLSRRDRKRGVEANHPSKLSIRDGLLLLLVYYRLYVMSILVRYHFDLDQSNVLKNIRMLEPVVRECVPLPKKVHERAIRARTIEEVEEYFPGFKAFIDATEQEIARPRRKQKRFNRRLSKARVIVGHIIARMKEFRLMAEEFRNKLKRDEVAIEIASGLVNLRILGNGAIAF